MLLRRVAEHVRAWNWTTGFTGVIIVAAMVSRSEIAA